jgi:PAS domain S-box-containing protein
LSEPSGRPWEFDTFFKAVPGFLSVQDRDCRIIAGNDHLRSTFGSWDGRYCYEVYKGRSTPCPECPVRLTFADGKSYSMGEVVTLPGGRQLPILVYTSPVLDGGGEVRAVVKMCADISSVKSLEERLRESRERFRLLFEEVPCYISLQDRDLRIVQANRSFQEAFGNYVGAYCYEVYKHRGEPCLNCSVAKTFQDGKVHRSEEIVTAIDGRQINTLVSTAPIRGVSGEIDAVMELSVDITEIRQLQGQLTNLGLLVGSISHGIKGLLQGLDGGIYLMNSGLEKKKPERIDEGWRMVQRNVETIRNVVMDLLYVAKEREPQWELVSAYNLARSAASALVKRATDLQIDFRIELDRGIGDVEAEAKSLQASLVNLLENAIDACRVDTRKAAHAVRFRLYPDADHVVFDIEDNGVGIDRETRERLFSLFFSSKGAEGTGLGLFVANKVVEKHRGTIQVSSVPGEGSRFMVSIPRTRGRENGA